MPFQQQLITARRNQILDAATKVFAEKGFHRATIRDVAQQAGIADGTIYNYFENKTALMLGILHRFNQTDERPQHFAQSKTMPFEAFFAAYMRQRYQIMHDNWETMWVIFLKRWSMPSFARRCMNVGTK